jgi:hypothetical protein
MNYLKSIALITCLMVSVFISPIHANTIIGGNMEFVTPTGEFGSNIPYNGFGGSGFVMWRGAEDSIFSFGGILDYFQYGNESRKEPFNSNITSVTVDVDRSHTIANFGFLMRYTPFQGAIQPYIDGTLGIMLLSTSTKITQDGTSGNDTIAESVNLSDWTMSRGYSYGVMINFYKLFNPQHDYQKKSQRTNTFFKNIFVDIRYRKMFGGNAKYMKPGSGVEANGQFDYTELNSDISYDSVDIGVAIYF